MSHEPEMIFLVLDSFINLAMNTILLYSKSCFVVFFLKKQKQKTPNLQHISAYRTPAIQPFCCRAADGY